MCNSLINYPLIKIKKTLKYIKMYPNYSGHDKSKSIYAGSFL